MQLQDTIAVVMTVAYVREIRRKYAIVIFSVWSLMTVVQIYMKLDALKVRTILANAYLTVHNVHYR